MEAIGFIQDLAVMLVVAGLVGWVCQRFGLSSVVGYLVAGVVVGPYTPPFALVTDVPRVETLAQLGLVILMFSIGMRLNLQKLRSLGAGLLLAVGASAGIVFALTRVVGASVGLSGTESLFLAGMMMVSSSAIISKVLADCGVTHERAGQLALAFTVLEDVVAVVMLTTLNSMIQFGGVGRGAALGQTLGMMSAFIVMAGVAGLLLVPWLLKRMSIAADEELQTLGVAGLLFALAVMAQKAGYSTALGAFLLGTIVSETPNRTQVDRIFDGMRSIFSAVFFVAIGMQIDPRMLLHAAPQVAVLTVFVLLVRTFACSVGLSLVGVPQKVAVRTGLMVIPLGEFSFIIAQLGVQAGVVPTELYPIAVGLSLTTALGAPFTTRHSERLAELLVRIRPKWLDDWIRTYHDWLERIALLQKRNRLWQITRKRIIQMAIGMLFVSGLLVFSERLLQPVLDMLGEDWLFPHGPEVLFWILLTLVILIPLFAMWRNIGAMAMLYAEISTRGRENEERLRAIVEHGLRILAGCGMFIWLATVIPTEGGAKWLLLLMGLVAACTLLFLRRKLIYWHSEAEIELQSYLSTDGQAMSASSAPWLQADDSWNMAVIDCVVPDLGDCRGKNLRELGVRSMFGASVVGIERQGFMIPLPGPDAVLYPRDKVLLMGNAEQVKAGMQHLTKVTGTAIQDTRFEDIRMDKFPIDDGCAACGMSLGEMEPSRRFGLQIAGIQRGAQRLLNPSASEQLRSGDELLALGTPKQLRAFRLWLRSSVLEPGGRV
jgi:CPA2 family monovalent cation:H+ antiporter-2